MLTTLSADPVYQGYVLLAYQQAQQQAEQERQAKLQAQQQAEQERQAKERLIANLRALGIDPDTL